MKNIKELSAEIKKEIGKPNRKSTESITIRLTKEEKKRLKALASACKVTQTQLIKQLINGANLKAIPPSEIENLVKEISLSREKFLEKSTSEDSAKYFLRNLQSCMDRFFTRCQWFYDEGLFSETFERYKRETQDKKR